MIFLKTFLLSLLTFTISITTPFAALKHTGNEIVKIENESLILTYYQDANLEKEGLSFNAFKNAITGYLNLVNNNLISNTRVLSVLDFNQPSTEKRFYILDLETGKLLLKTYVSHGVNSGLLYAERFSNKVNSRQSSFGMFKAAETYTGKYGLSLKLDGLEHNINNNARKRAIVLHPAKYVSNHFIEQNGYAGRSFGCPAVPYDIHKEVINYIKGGSALYINTDKAIKRDNNLSQLPDNTLELLAKHTNITPQKISSPSVSLFLQKD